LVELKALRQKEKFTHQDMANFLDISKAFYWQIENRKRTLTYTMAIKIASVFHKKPDEIFFNEFKSKNV
jgi:putative transcriptional regulator